MTNSPSDLLAFRSQGMAATGLSNPADVGIVGDGAHQHTGGYHEGRDVLASIGRFHAPTSGHVGSSTEDYSCRLQRDRNGLTLSASAVDIGAQWPHGGRPAWLRWNAALANGLHDGDAALAAVRAINYSPNGATKWRIDRQNGWRVESTNDTVDVHTHIEFYRDTEGRRAAALDRIVQLINQATGATTIIVAASTQGDDVSAHTDAVIDAWSQGMPKAADGTTVSPVAWELSREARDANADATQAKILAAVQAITAPQVPDARALALALAGNSVFVAALASAVATQLKGTVDEVVEERLNGATAVLSTAGAH